MRIVGGRLRGRPLRAPRGHDLRPTSDRAREGVFNVLAHGIEGMALDGVTVLDAFAGTGAYGLEALSRGAVHATFMDTDDDAIRCVRDNAGQLGEEARVTCLELDATRPPPPSPVSGAPVALVFLDPPYLSGLAAPALAALARMGWIAGGAVCVVETAVREPAPELEGFALLDERGWGAARVTFLKYEP